MEGLGESELFSPIIQLPGIGADYLAARSPSHFLEHGIGKKNLIGIVRDDDTVVQCFKNGPHLLDPLRFFAPQHGLLTAILRPASSPQNQLAGVWTLLTVSLRKALDVCIRIQGKRLAVEEMHSKHQSSACFGTNRTC